MTPRAASPLVAALATEFADPRYRADLASIVGARSDAELAAWVDDCCRHRFGQPVIAVRFAGKSVGAVFGLVLADGRSVVLKLFPPDLDDAAVAAIERCQAAVIAAGFPAPEQEGPLVRAGGLRGAFHRFVEGAVVDAHQPAVRHVLAGALARLAAIAEALDPVGLPLAPTRRAALWDAPHRVGIDYGRVGGEWIDARASAARRTIAGAALPAIPAHMDWSTKNALFHAGRLVAVLDWDSLQQASEAEMVGRAAAEFTAQWEFPARLTPTPDEATAFVREYEQARGRRFDDRELAVARASADYLMAQIARQELCGLDGGEGEFGRLLRETAADPLIR